MKLSFLFYAPISGLAELDQRMGRIARLGYQGIELTACHPLPYSVEDILALSRKHSLPVVSLLSGWSYGNEGLCLASPRAEVRQRASERLIEYTDYAARLGAVLVVGLMQGLRSDEPEETLAGEEIHVLMTDMPQRPAQIARRAVARRAIAQDHCRERRYRQRCRGVRSRWNHAHRKKGLADLLDGGEYCQVLPDRRHFPPHQMAGSVDQESKWNQEFDGGGEP